MPRDCSEKKATLAKNSPCCGVKLTVRDKNNLNLFYSVSYFILCTDLSEIDVNTFLGPFLDVIRSEDTTGPITGVALSSVNKFLSYGLIGMCNCTKSCVTSTRSGRGG